MARKTYHVTKTDDGRAAKAQGAQRASATGDTKAEVVQRATEIAKNQPGDTQVIIHKQNGDFQSERTYGNDPFPPEG